jgi:DNA-directed RNA polymerase subunit K/omega
MIYFLFWLTNHHPINMEEYYKLIEKLSRQTGGHYRLSTVLLKRVRQLVKGVSPFQSEPVEPISTAFQEFMDGRLQIIGEIEESAPEGKGRRSAKGGGPPE